MSVALLSSRDAVSSRGAHLIHRPGTFWHGLPAHGVISPGLTPSFRVISYDMDLWHGPRAEATVAAALGGWSCEVVDGGAANAEAIRVAVGAQGGVLQITNNAADNDATILRLIGESLKVTANKLLACLVSVAITDADDDDLMIGLVPEATGDEIATEPADGLYFYKAETDTRLSFRARKNSTNSGIANIGDALTDSASAAAAVLVYAGFRKERDGSITVWSGTGFDTLTQAGTVEAGAAGIVDDEELTLFMGSKNGAATADILYVGDFHVYEER